jgi:hypothetical protein
MSRCLNCSKIETRAASAAARRSARAETQRGPFHQINQLRQPHQIDRPTTTVQRGFGGKSNCLSKKSERYRTTGRHFQTHCLAVVAVLQALAQGSAQVADIFFVHRQIGVARNAELRKLVTCAPETGRADAPG